MSRLYDSDNNDNSDEGTILLCGKRRLAAVALKPMCFDNVQRL